MDSRPSRPLFSIVVEYSICNQQIVITLKLWLFVMSKPCKDDHGMKIERCMMSLKFYFKWKTHKLGPNCVTSWIYTKISSFFIKLTISWKVFTQSMQKYTFLESIHCQDYKSAKNETINRVSKNIYRVIQMKNA